MPFEVSGRIYEAESGLGIPTDGVTKKARMQLE